MKDKWVRKPKNGCVVIFVHGFLSSGDVCWRNNKSGSCWPELLKMEPELEMVGIYVYTYKTNAFDDGYTLGDIVDDLKERMQSDKLFNERRIIFVCHSMGGIVVRKLLVDRQYDFKNYEIGLFLIASPSLGPTHATLYRMMARIIRNAQARDLFSWTCRNEGFLADLNRTFRNLKEGQSLQIQIKGKELVEDGPIMLWGCWFLKLGPFVNPPSAATYFGEPYKIPNSDHSSIAKPEDRAAEQHKCLCDFITTFLENKSSGGNGAQRKPVPSNGGKADPSRLGGVRSFIDNGDHLSAINFLLGEESFEQSDTATRITVVMICQKFGLLQEAGDYLSRLRRHDDWARWQPGEQAAIEVISLKVASQLYQHEAVLSKYRELCVSLRRVEQGGLVPGVLRRAAVAYAVAGNLESATDVLEQAERVVEVQHDKYDRLTNNLYIAMTRELSGLEINGVFEGLPFLIDAQFGYLAALPIHPRFKGMPFKSTIQSLYAEAAVLFTRNQNQSAGHIRVAVAHLLGPLAHTNPKSEGYAELLSLITRGKQRVMFELAMRSDDDGRRQFQNEYGQSFQVYLTACRDIQSIAQPLGVESWSKVRALISRLDTNFAAE